MEIRVQRGSGKLQHAIQIGPHRLLTDAPVLYGGEETGPEPHDLHAASLAACTALTVSMYARRKGVNLQDVHLRVTHEQPGDAYHLTFHIHYVGDLSDGDRNRLTDIASKCPVHKTLTGDIKINTLME